MFVKILQDSQENNCVWVTISTDLQAWGSQGSKVSHKNNNLFRRSFTVAELENIIWHIPLLTSHKVWQNRKTESTKLCQRLSKKTNISYPLLRTRTYTYHGLKNCQFFETYEYILNGWSLTIKRCLQRKYYLKNRIFFCRTIEYVGSKVCKTPLNFLTVNYSGTYEFYGNTKIPGNKYLINGSTISRVNSSEVKQRKWT